jgi:hypothetical protein
MAEKFEVDPDLVIEASKKVHTARDIGSEALAALQDCFSQAIAACGTDKPGLLFLNGDGGQPGFAVGAKSMAEARRSFNDGADVTGDALSDVAASVVAQDQDSARGFG